MSAKAKRFVWESNDQTISDPGTMKQILDEIEFAVKQQEEENVVIFELVPRWTIVPKIQLIPKKFKIKSFEK